MNKYIRYIFTAVPYLIWNYPKIYFASRGKGSLQKRYNDMRYIVKHVMDDLNSEIILTGLKTLPACNSFLLTPNHQSFLDALVMIAISNQITTFVAKEEARKYIFVNRVIKAIEGLYLQRDNLRQEIKVMQQVRNSLMKENKKWVIFPEGTRSKNSDHSLLDFKAGAFKMAMQAKVDIYPVATWGSFRILDIKENSLKKQPIFVHICPPITFAEYQNMTTNEIANKVKAIIENQIEKLKILDAEYCKKNHK